MRPQEPRGHEGGHGLGRVKFGLETPLAGRFWGENKRLVFAPPLWYDWLVLVVTVGGGLAALGGRIGIMPSQSPEWWLFTGLAVCAAGVLAYLSSERMTLDLRQRTYTRREGYGPFKRITRGRLDDLDALVLQASEYPAPSLVGRTVVYRLVLFWKHSREPLLVCERMEAGLPLGHPLNSQAGFLLQKGQRYASEMKLPFYDNSHFPSADPQRFV